eukprot:1836862-Pyramimonas_sp.AAC.1
MKYSLENDMHQVVQQRLPTMNTTLDKFRLGETFSGCISSLCVQLGYWVLACTPDDTALHLNGMNAVFIQCLMGCKSALRNPCRPIRKYYALLCQTPAPCLRLTSRTLTVTHWQTRRPPTKRML